MALEDIQSSERIRVLIAHDIRVVCDGIASLLVQSPWLTIVDPPHKRPGIKKNKKVAWLMSC